MNLQKWYTLKSAVNTKFAFWRRLRNCMFQIQEIADKPFKIPEETFKVTLDLVDKAFHGDGTALLDLRAQVSKIRDMYYEEKYGS